jgi:hypothetical protein
LAISGEGAEDFLGGLGPAFRSCGGGLVRESAG